MSTWTLVTPPHPLGSLGDNITKAYANFLYKFKENCCVFHVPLPFLSMSSAFRRHVIWESDGLVAYLHPRPWTPGSVILESGALGRPGGSVFHLGEPEYLSWLMGARAVAELLCDRLGVRRCALVSRPHRDRPAQVRV